MKKVIRVIEKVIQVIVARVPALKPLTPYPSPLTPYPLPLTPYTPYTLHTPYSPSPRSLGNHESRISNHELILPCPTKQKTYANPWS